MLTGDHPLTAASIGQQVGLDGSPPVTGTQLAEGDDAALERAAASHSVFARFTPADKLRLVEAYQRRGEVVAVTGDGVNDTPRCGVPTSASRWVAPGRKQPARRRKSC